MTMLETDRLILRDLQESDLPALIALNQDPEVMQYFPKPYSQAELALQPLQQELKAYHNQVAQSSPQVIQQSQWMTACQ